MDNCKFDLRFDYDCIHQNTLAPTMKDAKLVAQYIFASF